MHINIPMGWLTGEPGIGEGYPYLILQFFEPTYCKKGWRLREIVHSKKEKFVFQFLFITVITKRFELKQLLPWEIIGTIIRGYAFITYTIGSASGQDVTNFLYHVNKKCKKCEIAENQHKTTFDFHA